MNTRLDSYCVHLLKGVTGKSASMAKKETNEKKIFTNDYYVISEARFAVSGTTYVVGRKVISNNWVISKRAILVSLIAVIITLPTTVTTTTYFPISLHYLHKSLYEFVLYLEQNHIKHYDLYYD